MKKNVILSTVAATVVTGVLMLSGCGNNSQAPESTAQSPGHTAEGTISITAPAGTHKVTATESNGGTQGGGLSSATALVKNVRCANGTAAPTAQACETVCTTAKPCGVEIVSACSTNPGTASSALDYSKLSDITGAWTLFQNASANNAVRSDATLKALYSGVTTLKGTGGISACDFSFSTFIVCALDKNGDRYFVNQDNSAGYAMVLIEYADGSTEWRQVDIDFRSNGVENGQPFINVEGLSGGMPAKITVFPVLNADAAPHTTGATGTTGAGA